MKKLIIFYCVVLFGIIIYGYLLTKNPNPPETLGELYSWSSIDVFKLYEYTLECDQAKKEEYIKKCAQIWEIELYLSDKEKGKGIANRKALDGIK